MATLSDDRFTRAILNGRIQAGNEYYSKGTKVLVKDYTPTAKNQLIMIVDSHYKTSPKVSVDTTRLDIGANHAAPVKVITEGPPVATPAAIPKDWLEESLPPLRKAGRLVLYGWHSQRAEMKALKMDSKCIEILRDVVKVEQMWWEGVPEEVKQAFTDPNPDLHQLTTYIRDRKLERKPLIHRNDMPSGSVIYLRAYEMDNYTVWYPGSAGNLESRHGRHRDSLARGINLGTLHNKAAYDSEFCNWKVLWCLDGQDSPLTHVVENLWICLLGSYEKHFIEEKVKVNNMPLMVSQARFLNDIAKKVFQRLDWRFNIGNGISISSPIGEFWASGRAPWFLTEHDESFILTKSEPIRVNRSPAITLFRGGFDKSVVLHPNSEEKANGLVPGVDVWPTVQIMWNRDHDFPVGRLTGLGPMSDTHRCKRIGISLRWQKDGFWYKSWHQFFYSNLQEFEWAKGQETLVPASYTFCRIIMDVFLKQKYTDVAHWPKHLKALDIDIIRTDLDWLNNSISLREIKDSLTGDVQTLPRPIDIETNMAKLKEKFPFLVYGKRPTGKQASHLHPSRKRCDYHTYSLKGSTYYDQHDENACNGDSGVCSFCNYLSLAPTWHNQKQLEKKDDSGRTLWSYIMILPHWDRVFNTADPRVFRDSDLDGNTIAVVTDEAIDQGEKADLDRPKEAPAPIRATQRPKKPISDKQKWLLELPLTDLYYKKDQKVAYERAGFGKITELGLGTEIGNAKRDRPEYNDLVQMIVGEQDQFLADLPKNFPMLAKKTGKPRGGGWTDYETAAKAWNEKTWSEKASDEKTSNEKKWRYVTPKELQAAKKARSSKLILREARSQGRYQTPPSTEASRAARTTARNEKKKTDTAALITAGPAQVTPPSSSSLLGATGQQSGRYMEFFTPDICALPTPTGVRSMEYSKDLWWVMFEWDGLDTPATRDYYDLDLFSFDPSYQEWRAVVGERFLARATATRPYPDWVDDWVEGSIDIPAR